MVTMRTTGFEVAVGVHVLLCVGKGSALDFI